MFSQPVRPYEGTTTTVNARNMVEKSAAHWSRPRCMVLHVHGVTTVETVINTHLASAQIHVCSLSEVRIDERGFATCTLIYQTRNEATHE